MIVGALRVELHSQKAFPQGRGQSRHLELAGCGEEGAEEPVVLRRSIAQSDGVRQDQILGSAWEDAYHSDYPI